MPVTALAALARQPGWRRWTLAAFLARLPGTMTLIALVLVGEAATGSLAVGAQLAGVATVVTGLAAPWRGRRLDRGDLRSGLQRASFTTSGVLVAEAVALALGLPLAVLFALAALQGMAYAGISGGFRALLVQVVPAGELSRARAVEATLVEIAFVAGPALAGAIGLVVAPAGLLLVMAGVSAVAAVASGRLPATVRGEHPASAAAWRTPGAGSVYALAFTFGATVGLLESAMPAQVADLGRAAAVAGPLLALTSAGSALGGLAAASAADLTAHHRRRAAALLLALGLLLVPVALTSDLRWLGVALFAAGVPIAPLSALGALVLQDVLPPGRQSEGFALFGAAIFVGAGIGQLVTGQLLDEVGPRVLLVATAALPLIAALPVAARAVATRQRQHAL